MRLISPLICAATLVCAIAARGSAEDPAVVSNVVVFGEEGKFGGWPANHGMWRWDDEILVGFSIGTHKNLGERHNIDREKPEYHVLARSHDGGETWALEFPQERGMLINAGGMRHGTTDPKYSEPAAVAITKPIDFTHPDFAMTMRFADINNGDSRLYYSYDRGHNWEGPFIVPDFGQPGIMARSDYIVNGPHDCHVFLTCSKQNAEEGRVFAARTTDGGVNWKFLSFVGPEPDGFSIMPSTVRLSPTELFMTTRRREGADEVKHRWIDSWRSSDNGLSWEFVGPAVEDVGEGNPPSLIRLADGRLCLTYGDRKEPFEIRAQLSDDNGQTWGTPIVLKGEGGGRDMGYTRSLQRPDGKVVTLSYFEPVDPPYRQIIATIWDPGIK
ncbi:MAG: exo-alpha-sialidase [Planctomycetales bacterium]|nr:exo-alpha-sialidase [Planctomycetales bacterium]